jgi:Sulfotransferase family
MERWVDKTPEYNRDLPVLLSLFPNAQFIHIVRDGRDVALSTFKMCFGASNAYRAASDWRRTILRINEFGSSLSDRQVLTIHYEALITEPAATMSTLASFLGIRNQGELMPVITNDIPSRVRQANHGKWRREMSTAEQRLFEAVAGDELRAFGYPTLHAVGRSLTGAERAYWEANHLLRKSFKTKYWSDTFYRAGVRVRTVAKGLGATGESTWAARPSAATREQAS